MMRLLPVDKQDTFLGYQHGIVKKVGSWSVRASRHAPRSFRTKCRRIGTVLPSAYPSKQLGSLHVSCKEESLEQGCCLCMHAEKACGSFPTPTQHLTGS